jgi:hypothetical protein
MERGRAEREGEGWEGGRGRERWEERGGWQLERGRGREGWEGRGGVAVGKGESDLGLMMVLFIAFFLYWFSLVRFNQFKLF